MGWRMKCLKVGAVRTAALTPVRGILPASFEGSIRTLIGGLGQECMAHGRRSSIWEYQPQQQLLSNALFESTTERFARLFKNITNSQDGSRFIADLSRPDRHMRVYRDQTAIYQN